MINDNLGMIANAHLVYADLSLAGAKCSECLQLAELHSMAVDFAKSGVPAVMPRVRGTGGGGDTQRWRGGVVTCCLPYQ